jgi:hypothetical protein
VTDGRITSQGQRGSQVRSKAWHIIHIIISCIEALTLSLHNLPTRLIRLAGTTHVLQYADQRLPRENQQPKRLVFSKTFCVSPCVARSLEVLTSRIFRMSLRPLTFTRYFRAIWQSTLASGIRCVDVHATNVTAPHCRGCLVPKFVWNHRLSQTWARSRNVSPGRRRSDSNVFWWLV